MIEELLVEDKKVPFNTTGLNEAEQTLIREITRATLVGAKERFNYALERCTFFADYGRDALEETLKGQEIGTNPHIEGDDLNPFTQHYWVAFDLRTSEGPVRIVIDPIFAYVGRKDQAQGVVRQDVYVSYTQRCRVVKPHKNSLEGGVRVNTMGI
ncbi:MAG TPA: hypothetical protein VJG90_01435 [Candidatus Nanoarchaeia archaeon]|nr:hypothetical protein [Candidatus Nanoarchaeia archaeon]